MSEPADDVEHDEALQAAETELPTGVRARDGADVSAREQLPKRNRLVREQWIGAVAVEPQDRSERERRRNSSSGGDRERKRAPHRKQEPPGEQRRAQTRAAEDRLPGLSTRVETLREQVGIERAIRRVVRVVPDEEHEDRHGRECDRSAERQDDQPYDEQRRPDEDEGQSPGGG